jgi:hypothetical protein
MNSTNIRAWSNGKYSVGKKNEFIQHRRIKLKHEENFPLKYVLFSTSVLVSIYFRWINSWGQWDFY